MGANFKAAIDSEISPENLPCKYGCIFGTYILHICECNGVDMIFGNVQYTFLIYSYFLVSSHLILSHLIPSHLISSHLLPAPSFDRRPICIGRTV